MKIEYSKSSFYVSILIFLALIAGLAVPAYTAQAATITVCASGCDYTTIQAAITAASAGDTINVGAGTYNENVVINKNDISLIGAVALNHNVTAVPATHTIIDGSAGPAVTTSPGITINSGITGVTIKNLRVQNFSSNSGIYGALGNNNLTIDSVHVYSNNTTAAVNGGGIYMNGPVSDVLINNVDSQLNKQRGIVIWNGFKQDITITNNHVEGNACCGIELQDGTASGVTITGNTVISNSDSGIAAIGLTSGAGPNVISGNTVTNNGRFGIEIKMPNGTGALTGDGSIVVENNIVSLPAPGADLRDFAGIAVMRLAYQLGMGYANVPTGVVVRNNTVSDYIQTSTSTGFGIVVEGTKMKVSGNTLENNDVGLQIQSGHTPYTANAAGDGDQSNLVDTYFGRGNSPVACVYIPEDSNTYVLNLDDDFREVGSEIGDPSVTNADGVYFCSIQESIDDATTLDGDTINVPAGTYAEDLIINKSITLLGPNSAINPNTGTRVAEAIIVPATHDAFADWGADSTCTVIMNVTTATNGVTIKGFTVDGDAAGASGDTPPVVINGATVDACEGIAGWDSTQNLNIQNNIIKHVTYAGVDFDNYYISGATSGNYIQDNLFEDIGETTVGYGIGVLIYDNFYADIINNVFDNVRTGIQTGNFYQANPGLTGSISNNDISVWRVGIFHNLWYSSASTIVVSNNTITAISSADSIKWNGILLSSFQSAVNATLSDNIIVIGSITQNPATGYNVWNTPTTAPLTISGGSVTGGQYGVWVNNYEGYASNASNTSIIIDGVTISGALTAGINVWDSPSNTNSATVTATLKNNVISSSAIGVQVSGSDATASGDSNQISGNTAGLSNTTAANLNFENNWWGAISGPGVVGPGSGDTVSANVDFDTWCLDAACTPYVTSIALVDASPTYLSTVDFTVTFSEPVVNVGTADFKLTNTLLTGTSIVGVTGSGTGPYTVTANTGTGDGTLRLDVPLTATIEDLYNNDFVIPYTSGAVYSVYKGIAPTIPILTLPAKNFLVSGYMPTLDWNNSSQVMALAAMGWHYEINVTALGGFNQNYNTLDNADPALGLGASQYTFTSPLAANTTFYWKVRAYNNANQYSNWSLTRTFRTKLATPVLNLPEDDANLNNKRPTFEWDAVEGATGYTLQIFKKNPVTNFFTVLANTGTIKAPFYTYTPKVDLLPGKEYVWKVKANGLNAGDYSAPFSFTTSVNPPKPPVLFAPSNNVLVDSSVAQTLDWNPVLAVTTALPATSYPVAASFEVQYSTNSAFNNVSLVNTVTSVIVSDNTALGTHSAPVSLLPGRTYYWRVRSWSIIGADGNHSAWSLVRMIKVKFVAPTLTSVVASPAAGKPTFTWSSNGNGLWTSHTIAVMNATTNAVVKTYLVSTPLTTYTIPVSVLRLPAGTYKWKVTINGLYMPATSLPSSSFTVLP